MNYRLFNRRMPLLLGLFFLIAVTNSSAQIWSKIIDLGGNATPTCIRKLADGGFIVCGYLSSDFNKAKEGWLARLDKNGDTLWTQFYLPETNNGTFNSVVALPNGGFVACGDNNGKAWFVKTKSNGDSVWSRYYGSAYQTYANDLFGNRDGTIVATGGTVLQIVYDANGMTSFLMKLSGDGDLLSFKTQRGNEGMRIDRLSSGNYVIGSLSSQRGMMGFHYSSALGATVVDDKGRVKFSHSYRSESFMTEKASKLEVRTGVLACNDLSYIVFGFAYDSIRTGKAFRGYMVKAREDVDSICWSRMYGMGELTQINDVTEIADGYAYVGTTYSLIGQKRMYFGKTDTAGNMKWEQLGSPLDSSVATGIRQMDDHCFLILCSGTGKLKLMKYDSACNVYQRENRSDSTKSELLTINEIKYDAAKPLTTIFYTSLSSQQLLFDLFDIAGRTAIHRDLGVVAVGKHACIVDNSELSSGVYYATFHLKNDVAIKKIAVIRE